MPTNTLSILRFVTAGNIYFADCERDDPPDVKRITEEMHGTSYAYSLDWDSPPDVKRITEEMLALLMHTEWPGQGAWDTEADVRLTSRSVRNGRDNLTPSWCGKDAGSDWIEAGSRLAAADRGMSS